MKKQEIIINLFEALDWIDNFADDRSEENIQNMINAISEAITILNNLNQNN